MMGDIIYGMASVLALLILSTMLLFAIWCIILVVWQIVDAIKAVYDKFKK